MPSAADVVVPVLPAPWVARGLWLRQESADDQPFLEQLFASVRQQEMDLSTWPQAMRDQFLGSQFELQRQQYARVCPMSGRLLIVLGQVAVGRLYLRCSDTDTHVVDLSLMPPCCGRGMGTALLVALQHQGLAAGKTLSLSVAMSNPAQRLYRRLGFVEVGQQPPYAHMVWMPSP